LVAYLLEPGDIVLDFFCGNQHNAAWSHKGKP
jgi:hypothetical protein